ncbi:DUF456 domain-containing protein [Haloferax mediterranei ATCC 33500]|uniref:DUF456 domain-containing protein n=1 Tax=Haloferax mediterranei (strain ATCC 33500 / DSM 1411 / JCM 8866 / NBRC 14739 / NCIMB 2177 / R-4) TaxID=523841 RepID=I3R855_HALMT|nr:DUF456 domain-containing protein [Haloferax mediterranei]AFK20415.1 hypothetical protein HFX_2738 [Haloferax mediterranei ATCC 33500]AHZ23779.1 hypothetical protein BM92_14505 [Haloferax mediterranei ATCC 33500]ELZ98200.1 hypothetical protein C439_15485 [Haloferax mediterranei ATCC 33500]MDX5986828.1 DUF456 domain-containing protein [Haloferax mediterranei ATCC 33500]QCQ76152.1 DUF456 domain-containing protein [Haloferax mediterranei ATCC 33500]
MDVFLWVAVALLVLGVVGSVLPLLPGALLSVIGVLVYWWSTGYSDPGLLGLVGLLLVGLAALAADYGAGFVAARVGGASNRTSLLAGLVGFVLLFLLGPLGIFIGVAGTVFLVEYYEHEDAEESGRRALYATVGVLASSVVQVLLTFSMLVGFALVVLL